jgi:hypothetical protein
MESNEEPVQPIKVPQYISALTMARLSGGRRMEVATNAESTTITVGTQKKRAELLEILRVTGYPTSEE